MSTEQGHAELARWHPQKWEIYRRCVLNGEPQKAVAASLGITPGTASEHLRDAKIILGASVSGLWAPCEGPCSIKDIARQRGVSVRALEADLLARMTETVTCEGCGKAFTPRKNVGASGYCSKPCRLRTWHRQSGKTCQYEGCTIQITDAARYCPVHHLVGVGGGQCLRCGEPFHGGGTGRLYCATCQPIAHAERGKLAREARKVPCREQGCKALVTPESGGFCRAHMWRYLGRRTCSCGTQFRPTGMGERYCTSCRKRATNARQWEAEESRKHPCRNPDCTELVTRKSTYCQACRPDRGVGTKRAVRQKLHRWALTSARNGGPDPLGNCLLEWLLADDLTIPDAAQRLSCSRQTLTRLLGYPKRRNRLRLDVLARLAERLAHAGALGRNVEDWHSRLQSARPRDKHQRIAQFMQVQSAGSVVAAQKRAAEAETRAKLICDQLLATEGTLPSGTRLEKQFKVNRGVARRVLKTYS